MPQGGGGGNMMMGGLGSPQMIGNFNQAIVLHTKTKQIK